MMALYAALARFASELNGSRIQQNFWVFLKIRGTFLEVPIIRIGIFWGVYWGPLFREITICFPELKVQLRTRAPINNYQIITCLGLVPRGVCPKRS